MLRIVSGCCTRHGLGRAALTVATIALTILGGSVVAFAANGASSLPQEVETMRAAARQAGVPEVELPIETPMQAAARKGTMPAWEQKITSIVRHRLRTMELNGVIANGKLSAGAEKQAASYSTAELLIDALGRVRVECKVDDESVFDDAYLASIGGQMVVSAAGYGLFVAWIPIDNLEMIARRDDVRLIMHIDPPYTDIGSRNTEGDAVHRADSARARLGLDGTGITIGVISDGVDNLAASQGTGDLPGGVTVSCGGAGDEGTAMLEIVYDLAPGANLAFCSGNPGSAGMITAIQTLAALPGMDIITDDLPKPGEPLFEDGPIAQAKQAAFGAGIFYTASSGNRGNQHYEAFFNSTATDVVIGPNTYENPHDFGGGDYRLNVTLGSANSLFLQWADLFGASGNDFDLYVVTDGGSVIASSTNTQSGSQDPNESVSFNATNGTSAHIIVDYVGGGAAPNVFFDLRGFNGMTNWEINMPQGSVNGASRQTEVYAAGASFQGSPTVLETFSSRGPIRHFFPGQLTRMKPDAVAVDGVAVTGAGGFGQGTCPVVNPGDVCQFFGTSASTPHVAGLAALLLEEEGGLTPTQLANALNSTAIDIDAPGPDNNAGNGLLDIYAAICLFDDEPPTIDNCPSDITVQCTGDGGIDITDAQLAAFFNVTATDLCDVDVDVSHDSPAFIGVGSITVTFTAVDDAGNDATCSADITVIDDVPPVITCPDDLTFECDEVGPFGTPTATDVCDPDPVVTLVIRDSTPGDCPQEYVLLLTYEARDFSNNVDSCQQMISVIDTTAPEIVCEDTVHIDFLSPAEAEVSFTVTATDNCDDDPEIVCDSLSGSVWELGYHEVECVADDGCGNQDTCSFRFLLVPLDIKPGSCPNPLNVKAQGGKGSEFNRFDIQTAKASPDEAVVPVAILGREDIDVSDLDIESIRLAGVAPVNWAFADVAAPVPSDPDNDCECWTGGPDGYTDLTLKFSRVALIAALGSLSNGEYIMVQISGTTYDGTQFAGGDCMLVRGTTTDLAGIVDGPQPLSLSAYPNPFNAATTISYTLPEDGAVNLTVYNILGQKVATLVSDEQTAGRHEVTWSGRTANGNEVASGVYFYRLQAANTVLSRKMMLLK